jgi:hypothetical protein
MLSLLIVRHLLSAGHALYNLLDDRASERPLKAEFMMLR